MTRVPVKTTHIWRPYEIRFLYILDLVVLPPGRPIGRPPSAQPHTPRSPSHRRRREPQPPHRPFARPRSPAPLPRTKWIEPRLGPRAHGICPSPDLDGPQHHAIEAKKLKQNLKTNATSPETKMQQTEKTNATWWELTPRELAGTQAYCTITRDLMQQTEKTNATWWELTPESSPKP
jgi:hypothetical protein